VRAPHDAAIKAALSPLQVVAMTVWAEARAEPIEGQVAVAAVIRNRLLRPRRFAATWEGVCLAPWQFSCWIPEGGDANYRALMARCAAAQAGTQPWPAQAIWVAQGIISGVLEARVARADHYYATWMPKPPTWARGLASSAEIGAHRFYRVP
jgi:spore germination cell wall hydrolase CwlJ-like protein